MALYRSYEVLAEETSGNHKNRDAGKTKKKLKPNYQNTCRALKVTHELFQDAVCYYILCLIGLIKDKKDENGEPTNPMWEYLRSDDMKERTVAVLAQLASRYLRTPFHRAKIIDEFFCQTYGWKASLGERPTDDSLSTLYKILFQQAKGTNTEDQAAALENLKTFASIWVAILCNEDGDTTIPGQGVYDRLHRKLAEINKSSRDVIGTTIGDFLKEASQQKEEIDRQWREEALTEAQEKNVKEKKPKSNKKKIKK